MNTPPRKESETGLYAPVWRKMNQLIDYMREISLVSGRNIKLTRTMNGTLALGEASVSVPPAEAGKIEQFKLRVVSNDTLLCVRWDGTTEGEEVFVYKPWKLRRTTWEGQTVVITTERTPATISVTYTAVSSTKRTATSPEIGTENQYVIPRYAANDIIYAMRCDDFDGNYIDLNVDGRAWAEHE